MVRTTVAGAVLAIAIAAGFAARVDAQDWPTRPVKILIPFTAGGTADTLGRIAAQKLSAAFGKEFVPENKPGASGLIAAAEVVNSPPDGYTLFVSGVGGLIISSAISPNPPADAVTGYTHIALFGGPPAVLLVNNEVPAHNLKEFAAYAKANPGKLNYGSSSIGSMANLAFSLFQQKTGISLQSIAYRGGNSATTDLIGGHILVTSTALTSATATIQSGKVRALGVNAKKQVSAYPDIPTFEEQGFPGMEATVWFSLSGPKGMPADIVRRINAAVIAGFQEPDARKRLAHDAIDPEPLDPAAFQAYVASENARWAPLAVQAIGKK